MATYEKAEVEGFDQPRISQKKGRRIIQKKFSQAFRERTTENTCIWQGEKY